MHGWIHENPASLSREQEKVALERSIETIRELANYTPVGYRAPSWKFSEHTVDILGELNLFYDSSLMSDDSPFEILRNGEPTGIVELPVSWVPDDASYLLPRSAGAISPRDFLSILKDDFDVAYRERLQRTVRQPNMLRSNLPSNWSRGKKLYPVCFELRVSNRPRITGSKPVFG